jgi:S1-C subfamily serine protease
VPKYLDAQGQPLTRQGDRLVSAGGDQYVLDSRGQPTRSGDTESGGCLCCSPPRALVRRRGEGLRCPATWESHLRDADRTLLERNDALGRCKRCDSAKPRVRDGMRIICVDCGSGVAHDSGSGFSPEPAPHPQIPSEHGRADHEDAFPKPPTRDELDQVMPVIRAAIMSNVFLRSKDGAETWNGSGIIIAREGNHIAILTNRHVVESDDGHRICAMKAMTVSGEKITVNAVWRAKRGVDLALVEGRVERPESLGVMPVGEGVAIVGAEVFAIGNPLGLAWSYSKGTLSAIRHWTTQDGLSVKVLQTDTNTAPGSSGGGLFHGDGHLIGVVSFGRSAQSGGSAHFAMSVTSIREAFSREAVRWRGKPLTDLP